jgi:hypothetical protein
MLYSYVFLLFVARKISGQWLTVPLEGLPGVLPLPFLQEAIGENTKYLTRFCVQSSTEIFLCSSSKPNDLILCQEVNQYEPRSSSVPFT